jgi:hypothetical protein
MLSESKAIKGASRSSQMDIPPNSPMPLADQVLITGHVQQFISLFRKAVENSESLLSPLHPTDPTDGKGTRASRLEFKAID